VNVNIQSSENTVWIRVTLPETNEPLWFSGSYSDKAIADIVRRRLTEALKDQIRGIRESAYKRGRKRAKRLRWISDCINNRDYVGH